MKIMALDIGNVWTGVALSDALGMFAKPYTTIKAEEIYDFVATTLAKEPISEVVVGYPKTMRGTESDQTKKTVQIKEELEKKFSQIKWILWDERLSSKQARTIKTPKNKQDKLEQHAIAAAIILSSYLQFKSESIY